ncbi:MAG: hypothetical protein U0169_22750 [Polyangiaceae bacterium]
MRSLRGVVRASSTVVVVIGTASSSFVSRSAAADPAPVALHLEGAASVPVAGSADTQTIGGGGRASLEWRPTRHLGAEAGFGAYWMPLRVKNAASDPDYAGYRAVAVGLRFRPLPEYKRVDLWVGVDSGAAFTGNVARLRAAGAIGMEMNLGRHFGAGPFVRYDHIFQPDGDALGPTDGNFVQFGLALSLHGADRPRGHASVPPLPLRLPPWSRLRLLRS